MTDAVVIAIIASVMPTVTIIVTSMLARMDRMQQTAVTKATAADVKDALTTASHRQGQKLDDIHVLVNGSSTRMLESIARLERRWADAFPGDATAQADAAAAEASLAADRVKQAGLTSRARPPGAASRSTDPHAP